MNALTNESIIRNVKNFFTKLPAQNGIVYINLLAVVLIASSTLAVIVANKWSIFTTVNLFLASLNAYLAYKWWK